MAYKIIYKKRFNNKLIKLLEYLDKEWNYKVAQDFLEKLDKRINTLKKQPLVGKLSLKKVGIRAILITKHNRLYYKIANDTIIVLNMYDTRSNPKKNPYKDKISTERTSVRRNNSQIVILQLGT